MPLVVGILKAGNNALPGAHAFREFGLGKSCFLARVVNHLGDPGIDAGLFGKPLESGIVSGHAIQNFDRIAGFAFFNFRFHIAPMTLIYPAVPSGLIQFLADPSVKTLGYFRSSLTGFQLLHFGSSLSLREDEDANDDEKDIKYRGSDELWLFPGKCSNGLKSHPSPSRNAGLRRGKPVFSLTDEIRCGERPAFACK
jgi:hypothetical protein